MSSSKPEQQVVQHFSHIHPLTKVDVNGEFICDGCKTYGHGETYRCASCNYDLHDHCATCPLTISSFMHPQHPLQLVEQAHQFKRGCDICREPVEGFYYRCETCDFDVHPLCTQLPQHVRHVPHTDHLLELSQSGGSSTCMVCLEAIEYWRYKCGPCGLDVHMECVNASASVARGIQRTSKRRKMYQVLKQLTLGVLCNIIAGPLTGPVTEFFKFFF